VDDNDYVLHSDWKFVMYKEYEIWVEGHRAHGSGSNAQLVAKVFANSFEEACIKFSKTKEAKGWGPFSTNPLAFWGCKLFDNHSDAARTFG
jgi:hypothetical protein